MMGATHAAIGMAAGMALATYAGATPTQVLFLGGVTALSALLPDVDHPQSILRRQLGFAGKAAFFWLPHRGFTHTLIALALVSAITIYFLPFEIAFAFIIGYASHLLADSLTHSGVPLVWPVLAHKYTLHLMKTGGLLEWFIHLLCVGVIGMMMLQLF